jgi:hypothetical protein
MNDVIELPVPTRLKLTAKGVPVVLPAGYELVATGHVQDGDLIGERPWEHPLHEARPVTVWNPPVHHCGMNVEELLAIARPIPAAKPA